MGRCEAQISVTPGVQGPQNGGAHLEVEVEVEET